MRREQGLKLAALTVGLLSVVSFFIAPLASFLAVIFGALSLAVALGEFRAAAPVPAVQVFVSLSSLYFLSEALLLGCPSSLALGVALSAVSILAVYVESRVILLRRGLGAAGAAAIAVVSAALAYSLVTSQRALEGLVRGRAYEPVELVTYSGLLYVAASLPYSSAILFGLVYLVYDLLRSTSFEEPPQPVQQAP